MLDFGFYNRDCMEGMKEFPDKYFDLAIVDPPYGIGITNDVVPVSLQTVHVEREPQAAPLVESRRLAVKVGGENLSRPKATTRLMTTHRPPRNISRNSNGYQKIKSYGAATTFLKICPQRLVSSFGTSAGTA